MAAIVLIIDDEADAAKAIAEMCRPLGLETVTVTNPAEALDMFQRVRPGLVILDLFLPGTDGMKLGQSIRGAPGGMQVPILAVSGVLKQRNTEKDVRQAVGADFMGKPLDVADFQARVSKLLGIEPPKVTRVVRKAERPAAAVSAFTANLASEAPYRLFLRLFDARASGVLELSRGQARRRLVFHHGWIRFATSNVKQENAGGMQVAQGTLPEASFKAAVEHAKANRTSLGDALLAVGALDAAGVKQALDAQVFEVAGAAMGWADGEAKFTPDPAGAERAPDHRVHPLAAVVSGIARFYPAATLRSHLEERRATRLSASPLLTREQYTLRQIPGGEHIGSAIATGTTLGELLDATDDETLPLLFAAVAGGLAQAASSPTAGAGAPAAAQHTPGAAAPVDEATLDAGKTFSPEEQAARSRIVATWSRIKEATHYEILSVEPKADGEAVQKSYLVLAREWHTDRFSGLDLGSAAPQLESLFSRIGEARAVLSDPQQRAEYDVYLDRKAKGLPTDVGEILKAEELFQKGEVLVKRGKFKAALASFEEAIRLNHAELEFYAWRGYARYLTEGKDALAAAHKDIEHALSGEAPVPQAHYIRGAIALAEGDAATARQEFERTLELRQDHTQAQQQLRVLRMRQEKEGKEKGGLLGKLLKR